MIDDDELTGAGDLDGEEPPPRSNRGFWIIATSLALVGILMVIAIVANRPLKDTIGHTESDLNGALLHAQRVGLENLGHLENAVLTSPRRPARARIRSARSHAARSSKVRPMPSPMTSGTTSVPTRHPPAPAA